MPPTSVWCPTELFMQVTTTGSRISCMCMCICI